MTAKLFILCCAAVLLLRAQDTLQPVPVTKVPPAYPESAKKLRVEAQVFLSVLVGTNGTVMESELLQAAARYPGGTAMLGSLQELTKVPASHRNTVRKLIEVSQQTVRKWTFTPAKVRNEPVEAMIVVPFTFRLENNPPAAPPKQQRHR